MNLSTPDWIIVIFSLALAAHSPGAYAADQTFAQRTRSCLRPGHGRAALILSGLLCVAIFVAFLFAGTMFFQYVREADLPTVKGTPGRILATFYVSHSPHVLRGLMVTAIIALGMATLVPVITGTSLTAAVDFRQIRIGPHDAKPAGMGSFRFYGFLVTVAVTTVAWFSAREEILASIGAWIFVYLYGLLLGREPARDSTAIRKSNESTSIRKPKQP